MTAIEKLNRVRDGKKDFEWQLNRIEELTAMAERVTPVLSDTGVHGGASLKDDSWAKLIDAKAECKDRLDTYLRDCDDLYQELECIHKPNIKVAMRYRFVSCMKIEDIATTMVFDERWVRRLIAKGIKIYCEEYQDD